MEYSEPSEAEQGYEDDSDSCPDEDESQDESLEDSDSPEAQESEQAEDDPEEKEVRDDCGSQITEDCHGGDEATRSVESSPSVAENGQEDRDSDQTENGGDEGEGEGENGESGETTHSSDNGEDSGENGSGSGEGEEDGTESSDEDDSQSGSDAGENQDTSDQNSTDEGENQDIAEGGRGGRSAKVQALIDALNEGGQEDGEPTPWDEARDRITKTIIEICQLDCGRIKHHQTSWDTRAMARDVAIGRWDKVLRDKHWTYRPRELAIFWDQSGSCREYLDAVAKAIKEVARLGYHAKLYDCSNGIQPAGEPSVVWKITGKNQTTVDGWNNGPRLKEVAKELGRNVKLDANIIKPNAADFIKICERANVVMVLQDYDCVETVWLPSYKVSKQKCPHFIDLETRDYSHPCEHDWNPKMDPDMDWAVPDRWHKIWDISERWEMNQ